MSEITGLFIDRSGLLRTAFTLEVIGVVSYSERSLNIYFVLSVIEDKNKWISK